MWGAFVYCTYSYSTRTLLIIVLVQYDYINPSQARKANYLIGVFVCLLKLEGSR